MTKTFLPPCFAVCSSPATSMSSFVGTTVRLTPKDDAPFFGTIMSVDPSTATLMLRRADTGEVVSVRRQDLLDVSTVKFQTSLPSSSQVPASTSAPAQTDTTAQSATSSPAPSKTPGEASDKKKRNRKKTERRADSPAARASSAHPGATKSMSASSLSAGVDEEFDFVKSAQSFDKKKIWDEIRVRLRHN